MQTSTNHKTGIDLSVCLALYLYIYLSVYRALFLTQCLSLFLSLSGSWSQAKVTGHRSRDSTLTSDPRGHGGPGVFIKINTRVGHRPLIILAPPGTADLKGYENSASCVSKALSANQSGHNV